MASSHTTLNSVASHHISCQVKAWCDNSRHITSHVWSRHGVTTRVTSHLLSGHGMVWQLASRRGTATLRSNISLLYVKLWIYETLLPASVTFLYSNYTHSTSLQGCKYCHDKFRREYGPWTAFRTLDYGYTRGQFFNSSHMYLEQISIDQVIYKLPLSLSLSLSLLMKTWKKSTAG